ncbi:MAG: DKNYY domain-containing protein [Anaerolineales bacterium]|nr:DKNYY domain-containing protein [Anaerolineales bacterium]MBX3037591.1 DKNYY domain-containing protein [Anaerolineales bacterium]
MKTNRTLIISITIFLCLICLLISGIGYFYLANQPPNRLSDSGYYIRITKVYYYPGFGLSEPFEIANAHVSTFEILDETHQYAKDINHVYFQGVIIPDADSQTFYMLSDIHRCAADENHVYYWENIIPNFDPNTIPPNATVTYCSPDEVLFTP